MPALKLTDDLGRTLAFTRPPQRVVSLVPSDTYSIVALGAGDRLVGRTTYCEHGEGVATVGGTKDVDVEAVLALGPDLVIANQEENTRAALEALAGRVPVLVSLPRTVAQGFAHLARLARILGVEAAPLVRRAYTLPAEPPPAGRRAFVPIWMDPPQAGTGARRAAPPNGGAEYVMTLNADTFGSDVLARAGVANAFGDRLRLYPLAADLGKSAPVEAPGRDVRYPRVTLDEVRGRGAELLVLPDEPYAFTAGDERVLREALPTARVVRVSGKDLFWYGAWTLDALDRLSKAFA